MNKIVVATGVVFILELVTAHLTKPPPEGNAAGSVSVRSSVERTQLSEPPATAIHRIAKVIFPSTGAAEDPLVKLEDEIERALQSTNATDRKQCLDELLPELVRRDALAAGQFVEMLTSTTNRDQALESVARAWVDQDPASALEWISRLSIASDQRDKLLSDACFQIAVTSPAQAVDAAQQYGLDKTEPWALENLTQQWAANSVSASLAWAESEPPGTLRNQLLSRVAFVQSQSDPADAARLVVEQIPPGPEQIEAAISVLHQWGQRDMAAAMAWAQGFPEGPLQDRAMAELAGIAQTGSQQ